MARAVILRTAVALLAALGLCGGPAVFAASPAAAPPAGDGHDAPSTEVLTPGRVFGNPTDGLQAHLDAAPAGAVVEVRGRHVGGLVIRKPLHLVGDPGAVIDARGRGTVVRIEAAGVTVRGLTLRGSGTELNTEDSGVFVAAPGALLEDLVIEDVLFGLNLKGAHGTVIRRVSIRGRELPLSRRGDGIRLWDSDAVVMTELRLERTRDILLWYSTGSTLHRLNVRGSRYGVHGMYADQLRVLESHFEDNTVGGYLMYCTDVQMAGNRFVRHRGSTGVGLAFKESDGVVVRGNLIAGNATGLYLDGTPRVASTGATFTGNVIAGNETGLHLLSSASGNVIAGNFWDHNGVQVRVDGGKQAGNRFAKDGSGNYWSDYAGVDLRGDGIGDQPYRARLWFEVLGERVPELQFFTGSLAAAAIDFAARTLPVFAPSVVVEDPRPLMQARVPAEFRQRALSLPFAAAALLLAGLGAAAIAVPGRRSWRGTA